MEVNFNYGALGDSLEKQANKQGYTLGKEVGKFDKIKNARSMLSVHGLLTDSESRRVVNRIHKLVIKNLKQLDE